MNIKYNSLTQCTVEFFYWVMQVILKLFCLKLRPYSFTIFSIITKRISDWHTISASENFCSQFSRWQFLLKLCNWHFLWQLCRCQRLLQLCRFWGSVAIMLVVLSAFFYFLLSATLMLVNLFVAVMKLTFRCNYAVRSFCNTYAGESFCSKYVGDNFYWNYACGNLCCNHAGSIFCSALCTWLFPL